MSAKWFIFVFLLNLLSSCTKDRIEEDQLQSTTLDWTSQLYQINWQSQRIHPLLIEGGYVMDTTLEHRTDTVEVLSSLGTDTIILNGAHYYSDSLKMYNVGDSMYKWYKGGPDLSGSYHHHLHLKGKSDSIFLDGRFYNSGSAISRGYVHYLSANGKEI